MRLKLNQLVRENFVEKVATVARLVPSMHVWEGENFTAVDCELPSDTFNVVVARDLSAPLRLLAEAVAPFATKYFPFALWYWDDPTDRSNMKALTDYGLTHSETHVAMAADLPRLTASPIQVEGLELRVVSNAGDLRAHGAVIADLFGTSEEGRQVAAYYDLLSTYPLETFPALRPYIGIYGGAVVATGTLFMGQSTVGIYDIVTRADVRGCGIGSAMFGRLLSDARRAELRYAVLQASADGLGIYARAGFEAVGKVHTFENGAVLRRVQ